MIHDFYLKHLLVLSQFDRSNMSFEAQFANAFETNVVPQKHFVSRKFRLLSSTNESQDICSEHHFYNPDTTIKLYTSYE